MERNRPSLCIAGNLLGENPGYITTQGQIIAHRFRADGFDVITASSKLNSFIRLVDVVWTVSRNCRRTEILLVEVYSGLAFILADTTSFLSNLFGIPTILVLHGGNLPDFARKYPSWVMRVFQRAGILVAPSTYLSDKMSRYGFNIRVIPNVIDLSSYEYRLREKLSPKIFWMRSFHPIYNPQLALDAFALVRNELPGATLVMAGVDKGLEKVIKNSAFLMGLQDAVRFPGFLDEKSKLKEFSGADVYINTNRIDNMPVSVVEACAMGLPVVATDVGGLSRLISHEENGLLVKDEDPVEMAKAIIRLVRNPSLAGRLSRNGRLMAEKSAWTNVRRSWIELFQQLLSRKSRAVSERLSGSSLDASDQ